MTAVSDAEAASYCRKAAALWAHHSRQDSEGFSEVISEVRDQKDAANVILALLNLFEQTLPAILQPAALAQVNQLVVRFAEREHRP